MKKKTMKLDVTKLYGFNLNTDKSKVRVSSAASAKIGGKAPPDVRRLNISE